METCLIIIVIISFLSFIFAILHNKFQLTIIKIDKAEEDIDIYLERKKELLSRTIPIIKKELKVKEFLTGLEEWKEEFNNFEKHNLLKSIYNEFLDRKIVEKNIIENNQPSVYYLTK